MQRVLISIIKNCLIISSSLLICLPAFAFETTKVLPKGVRNLTIRTVDTSIKDKNNDVGETVPVSDPLQKGLTFDKIIRGEKGILKDLAVVGRDTVGMEDDTELGSFTADLRGDIRVIAPIFAYGISEKLTFGMAIPYYQAATKIEVGFQKNENADLFIQRLHDLQLTQGAIEAGAKLNNAVGRLQDKLEENGYQRLDQWQQSGYGDLTVLLKYLALDQERIKAAATVGLNAPTGRVDNPDILIDIPFGDGTWDAFTQLTFDFPLYTDELLFNQYTRYRYQFEAQRDIRLITEAEAIEGEKKRVSYKMGDVLTSGVSLQWEPSFGLVTGAAAEYLNKYGDRYDVDNPEVDAKYRNETSQIAWRQNYLLGYSTLPAFKRKSFPAPLKATLMYSTLIRDGVSLPKNELYQLDISLFF
ncbi:MAG: hypothetical protein KBD78_06450 [Oligoflexales bacterium]|nr:hypothetical protein [Oligoflexales bacterium]